jgi:excinuclease UvrABC ATPase subunit
LVLQLLPDHLTRSHRTGRCTTCSGVGTVETFPDEHWLAKASATADDEALLSKEALDTVRGTRRSEWLPLVARLTADGVWPDGRAWSKLEPRQRNWFLFGCWARPGYGTYLRPKADPTEVGAWIRWDGLYRHVRNALERAAKTHAKWAESVRSQSRAIPCPTCEGVGIRRVARAVAVAGKSVHEWISAGTVGELAAALKAAKFAEPRNEKRRKRLAACLEKIGAKHSLREPLHDDIAIAHARRLVGEFTTLGALRA